MFKTKTQTRPNQDWQEFIKQQKQTCKEPALQRFYHASFPEPHTPIGEVPMMALDFETTGMDASKHTILSIGMVPFNLQSIRPADGKYWVVKPQSDLHEESIIYHRITHSEIESAPDINDVLDDILDQIAGHLVVVHYHNIERRFLDKALINNRGESCLFPMIDTMLIEARFERVQRFQNLKRWFGIAPPSIRLDASRKRYNLPRYSSHHAKVDALATAELLQAQIAKHYSPKTPISALWT